MKSTNQDTNRIEILEVEKFSIEHFVTQLREITMLEDISTKPYKDTFISLENICVKEIAPAQRYVLSNQLLLLRELKWELEKYDVDMFNLNGFVRMTIKGKSKPVDLLPPIVEESIEKTGHVVNLINDGMHRLFLANLEWVNPQVVFIRGIPKNLPYYSFPIPQKNWSEISMVDEIPERFIKKWHRIKDNKTLYRNFDSVFQNVGQPRGNFSVKN